jgi:hypothetical protein
MPRSPARLRLATAAACSPVDDPGATVEAHATADVDQGPECGRPPVGRPPKYRADFARQAAKLCELGATDDDLAAFFAVNVRTIGRWKVEHEAFCAALKLGKGAVDDKVERSLYQRAVGYSYDTVKIFTHQGQVIRAEYREHYPPDTTAAIFWLKNRRPEEWRDKQDLSHGGKLTVELVKFSDDPDS